MFSCTGQSDISVRTTLEHIVLYTFKGSHDILLISNEDVGTACVCVWGGGGGAHVYSSNSCMLGCHEHSNEVLCCIS